MIKLVKADAIDLLKSIDTSSVKAIIQDPPYSDTIPKGIEYKRLMRNNTIYKFNKDYWYEFLKEAKRVLKKDGFIASTISFTNIHHFLFPAEELGFKIRRIIILVDTHSLGAVMYNRMPTITQFIPVLSTRKETKFNINRIKKYFEDNRPTNVWMLPPKRTNIRFPASQPLYPFLMLVELLTDEGDLVVDPFCGSGTTGEACAILGRRFIGGDISEESLEKAKIRLGGYMR